MALLKSDIKAAVKAALEAAQQETDPENREAAIDAWSEEIAGAIGDAIATGISDTTVVFTLAAPNGPVTGTITLQPQVQ